MEHPCKLYINDPYYTSLRDFINKRDNYMTKKENFNKNIENEITNTRNLIQRKVLELNNKYVGYSITFSHRLYQNQPYATYIHSFSLSGNGLYIYINIKFLTTEPYIRPNVPANMIKSEGNDIYITISEGNIIPDDPKEPTYILQLDEPIETENFYNDIKSIKIIRENYEKNIKYLRETFERFQTSTLHELNEIFTQLNTKNSENSLGWIGITGTYIDKYRNKQEIIIDKLKLHNFVTIKVRMNNNNNNIMITDINICRLQESRQYYYY